MVPGLLAILILASWYIVPIAGMFMVPLLPAPLAYARLRYGSANFFASSASCILLVGIAGGFPAATAVTLAFCLTGYALGGSLRAGESDGLSVLKGTLLPAVTVGPLALAYFLLAGVNPWAMLGGALDQGLKESVELYKRMGMSQADIEKILPSLKTFSGLLVDYFPAVLVCLTAVTSLSCYSLVKARAVRSGVLPDRGTPMDRWLAPDHAVWGVIVTGFLLIPPVPLLRQAAGNLFLVFAMVYLFQGIAVTAFLFERFKLHPALRAFVALLIALQPFLLFGMWCVGLFDTWADFRKLRPGKGPG